MLITCADYYLEIIDTHKRIARQTIENDVTGLHANSHRFIKDFSHWINILSDRPEIVLLKASGREYQHGLISVINGQYRQAFNSLRFFIEHSLAAIYFSANELQLRLWLKGQQDIFWSNIVDPDQGIFSKRFVGAFCESLTEYASGYNTLTKGLYRECSEYTHGNYITQDKLPINLEYNEQIFNEWHDKAETAQLIIIFALCFRYITSINKDSKCNIEASVMDRFEHIAVIQALLEM